ncbi:putative T7SS-secreted protein [Saccharopolyspora spinosa]|uniref:putative T7SS-secreted protein n=1 Tax=Saccharopolyspora spinosa TaxID=60894 RepID=UPI003748719F
MRKADPNSGMRSGEAAYQFRSAFDGESTKYPATGDCFHASSRALETYASTLTWAQDQAAKAMPVPPRRPRWTPDWTGGTASSSLPHPMPGKRRRVVSVQVPLGHTY